MSEEIRDRWANEQVDAAAANAWRAATGQEGTKLWGKDERAFVHGMTALLTGAPPPPAKPAEQTLAVEGIPSNEYLDWLIDEVGRKDCEFFRVPGPVDEWKIIGNVKQLTAETLEAVKRHKPIVLDRLRERFPDKYPALGPPLPAPDRLVEWVAMDDHAANPNTPLRGRFCKLAKLKTVDWVRWQYMGTSRWYEPNGDHFDEW